MSTPTQPDWREDLKWDFFHKFAERFKNNQEVLFNDISDHLLSVAEQSYEAGKKEEFQETLLKVPELMTKLGYGDINTFRKMVVEELEELKRLEKSAKPTDREEEIDERAYCAALEEAIEKVKEL